MGSARRLEAIQNQARQRFTYPPIAIASMGCSQQRLLGTQPVTWAERRLQGAYSFSGRFDRAKGCSTAFSRARASSSPSSALAASVISAQTRCSSEIGDSSWAASSSARRCRTNPRMWPWVSPWVQRGCGEDANDVNGPARKMIYPSSTGAAIASIVTRRASSA
jgi:hypothetical protein